MSDGKTLFSEIVPPTAVTSRVSVNASGTTFVVPASFCVYFFVNRARGPYQVVGTVFDFVKPDVARSSAQTKFEVDTDRKKVYEEVFCTRMVMGGLQLCPRPSPSHLHLKMRMKKGGISFEVGLCMRERGRPDGYAEKAMSLEWAPNIAKFARLTRKMKVLETKKKNRSEIENLSARG